MIIGIISDTHDNIYLIDEVVEQLNKRDVNLVLHAGDYVSPFTVSHFKPLKAKLIGVFGNNCAERELLKRFFTEIGAEVRGGFTEVSADDLKIALYHGHEEDLLNSLINSGGYDVVICGHTHKAETYKKGDTTVINPGEVCGYLPRKSTYALLDTQTLRPETVRFK